MQTDVQPHDAGGRDGDEEFLVLLPGCNGSDTGEKAERLRDAISREPIQTPAGTLGVLMSVGGVAAADWPRGTANQILQMADSVLYRAKGGGRNRTVMAGAVEHQEAHPPSLDLSSHRPQSK
jgi:diguanylate cyclase (GGDEF)-like protein